jgi:choline monooxygenase
MNELIPHFNYHKQEIFESEIEKVFKTNWLFGCMLDDIPNKNDFYVLEIHKHSIIFYNNGSGINAFKNVCPHRFNRIITKKKGNGKLFCKFHSWSFDGCGKVRNNNVKGEEQIKKYSLNKYAVEVIGKFVFFNFENEPKNSIKEQYGQFIDEIVNVSEIINKKIYEDNIEHDVNWKIICENIIEISHCQSLHQESLVKIGYCTKPVEEFQKEGNNSYMIIPPEESKEREKRDKFLNKNLPRAIQNNKYKHTLFFPNFTIGIYEGLNITIGLIIPINSKKSVYRLLYYTSHINSNSSIGEHIMESMENDTIHFGTQVFNEDKVIIEQVQKGVEEATHSGMVYESDKRVLWFMESYLKLMKN